jgi:Tfp pilus assembly protein PilN
MRTSVRSMWQRSFADSLSWQSPIALVSRPFWRSPSAVRTGARLRPRTALGLVLIILLLSAAGWLYLEQTAVIKEAHQSIGLLQEMQKAQVRDIRYLQLQVAQQTSMEQVFRYAQALRLQPEDRVDILVVGPLVRSENLAQAR